MRPTTLAVESAVKTILAYVGEDVKRDGLKDTPSRFRRMLDERLSSVFSDLPKIPVFEQKTQGQIIQEDIPFWSFCEHHMVPFGGFVTIGYMPSGNRVIGLSKLARITDYFSDRLQVQERITEQIANFLFEHTKLKPNGVIVVVKAHHLCMEARGVRKTGTSTTTCEIRGDYSSPTLRNEFFSLIKK